MMFTHKHLWIEIIYLSNQSDFQFIEFVSYF